jgi:hypothetical protein
MNDINKELVKHAAIRHASKRAENEPLAAWLLGTGYAAHWTWRLARISAGVVSNSLPYSAVPEKGVATTPR